MNVGDHFTLPDTITAEDCGVSPELFNRFKNQRARILAATAWNFYCLCNGHDIRIPRELIENRGDDNTTGAEHAAKADQ